MSAALLCVCWLAANVSVRERGALCCQPYLIGRCDRSQSPVELIPNLQCSGGLVELGIGRVSIAEANGSDIASAMKMLKTRWHVIVQAEVPI